jgi:hypothetical protein
MRSFQLFLAGKWKMFFGALLLIGYFLPPSVFADPWPTSDPSGEAPGGTLGSVIYPDMQNKKLGIGTDSPAGSLDIFGNGKRVVLENTSINGDGGDCAVGEEQVFLDPTGISVGFTIGGHTITSVGVGYVCIDDDSVSWGQGQVKWWQDPQTEFLVHPSGNVGIGTEAPLAKLHIEKGDFLATSGTPVQKASLYAEGNTLSFAKDIDVVGDYLYVMSNDENAPLLQILSFTDADGSFHNISLIPDVDSGKHDVAVAGSYAYLTGNEKFYIVDISNKKTPSVISSLLTPSASGDGAAKGVYVSGKYAYLTGNDRISAIDISNLTSPRLADALRNTDFPEGDPRRAILTNTDDIAVYGKYAYVTSANNGMAIIDISDPTNMGVAGYLEHTAGTTALAESEGIAVMGKYAFIGGKGSNGLEVIDVSDPSNPAHVTAVFDNAARMLGGAQEIKVHWPYLYITGLNENAIVTLDITDPSNPVYLSHIVDSASSNLIEANGLFASGKNIYSVAYGGGVNVVETDGITAPGGNFGSLETGGLMVFQDTDVVGKVQINTGLNIGGGGLYSEGPLGVSSGISYFGGKVGVNDRFPAYALSLSEGRDMHVEAGGSYFYNPSEFCAAGFCSSDRTLKTNIVPLSGSLQKLMQLKPSSFRFLDEHYGKGLQVGLIAQEAEEVFPEWVTEGEDGYKKVRYGNEMNIHLVQAIKELDAKLEADLEALEQENDRLRQEIHALEHTH